MPADGQNSGKTSAQKPDGPSVIAAAIGAMRENPKARAAADAIEKAWSKRGFNVDVAVEGVKPPEPSDEEGT